MSLGGGIMPEAARGPLAASVADLGVIAGRLRAALDAGEAFSYDSETFGPELGKGARTRPDPRRHHLAGFSLAFVDGTRWYVPLRHTRPPHAGGVGSPEFDRRAWKLLNVLRRPEARVWAHNWAFDAQVLMNEGVFSEPLSGRRCQLLDSMIAAWLVGWKLPGDEGLKLKPLARHYLKRPARATFEDVAQGRQANEVSADAMAPYAAQDALDTLELGLKAERKFEPLGLEAHWAIELRCIPVSIEMERCGFPIDERMLLDAAATCEVEAAKVAAAFETLTRCEVLQPVKERQPKPCPTCGNGIGRLVAEGPCSGDRGKQCRGGVLYHRNGNPVYHVVKVERPAMLGCDIGSDAKVSRWLFRELRWWDQGDERRHPSVEYGPSVKADYVRKYAALPGKPGEAARLRLRFQALRKYCTTYTRGLVELAQQTGDGRLHASFKQTGTDTARYSCAGPNMQNWPASERQPLPWLAGLPDVRDALVAPAGWEYSVADYSQIELRLGAHYSREPELLHLFRNPDGTDMHTVTQQSVGGTCDRRAAKVLNFSKWYRIQPKALALKMALATNDFTWTPRRAGQYSDAWDAKYPMVEEYWQRAIRYAEEHGHSTTVTGFKRPIDFTAGRWGAENQAINTPIQGSAAGIIKLAMALLYEYWTAPLDPPCTGPMLGENVRIAAQVHDELVVLNRVEVGEAVRADLKQTMERVGVLLKLRVPLVVEVGHGPTYGQAK